ncbi:MAG: type III pantothenate kinase [Symploca sp. SIO3C6]|uniref:Type III pantothenate kinase n=1 Tax=Symploca sp. SIO1C4 TaxID=2607765 RepID=A0A6B3NBD2_9CYAN|nr:type III pantothenate kinase [Symploca sp. SIO3C6]NER27344.1 type III pantothenate kinase [Symploca sp. SIO1C4]NET05519.1 type III pantothenate kinase [Symploca sp. SIO2B6]
MDTYHNQKATNNNNKSRYLVLADIGNSAIKLGIADTETATIHQYITCETIQDCHEWFKDMPSSQIFYSSVRHGFQVEGLMPNSSWKIISAEPFIEMDALNFKAGLDLGIDRKLACLAAFQVVEQPFLVITMGTATTLSLVLDNTCKFSVIFPGLGLSVKAVNDNTRIMVEPNFEHLDNPAQTTTIQDSVHAGVLFSTVFAIEGWVNYFHQQQQYFPKVIISGGYSNLISKFITTKHIIVPNLTIKGLLKLFLNSKVRKIIQNQT